MPEPIIFNAEEAKLLEKWVLEFHRYLKVRLSDRAPAEPKVFDDLSREIHSLTLRFRGDGPLFSVSSELAPLLRTAVLALRRIQARVRDKKMEETNSAEMLGLIEKRVTPYDRIDQKLQHVEPLRIPSLLEFLTLERAEAEIVGEAPPPTRQYEQGFRILKAKSAILQDLHYFRTHCDLRGLPVALAFLDIDHFKNFNTLHTEVVVDRMVLPLFMRTLEAFSFGRGHAYLYGGDECVLILPNHREVLARDELTGLLRRLGALEYGLPGRTPVSMGLCVLGPDSALTDREALELAAQAKKFAKEAGRNRLAGYVGMVGPHSEPQVLAVGDETPAAPA